MPWSPAEAPRHTKAADTPAKRRLWARVANRALGDGHSEGSAIRIANAALRGHSANAREDRKKRARLI